MNIYYRILDIYPDNGTMTVRYWTDELTEELLASDNKKDKDGRPLRCRSDVSINIPIPALPTERKYHKYLLTYAPKAALERMEKIQNKTINEELNILSTLVKRTFKKDATEIEIFLKTPKDQVTANTVEYVEIIEETNKLDVSANTP